MSDPLRPVFYISDGTGVTAQTLGQSLLSQFAGVDVEAELVPFVDSPAGAGACVAAIRAAAERSGLRPILFTTLVSPAVAAAIDRSGALHIDLFRGFLTPLEAELGVAATAEVGRSHSAVNAPDYLRRMEAVNFTLNHDDGLSDRNLEQADVILVGVSRCGKTPTSVYLAMHHGLFAANYPLIPEDFERGALPGNLARHVDKLVGLDIEPLRLHQIRNERRPGSHYAALDNCRHETDSARLLMRQHRINWYDSTHRSVEELAAAILQARGLRSLA